MLCSIDSLNNSKCMIKPSSPQIAICFMIASTLPLGMKVQSLLKGEVYIIACGRTLEQQVLSPYFSENKGGPPIAVVKPLVRT